ncbi:hypothetical protein [Methyloligella solikamskensis]|uniref:Transposase n=1 Tax=Methyloligella solikamskensis TaxID=1177756 RepID=A0ABW3JCF3_9HYPH
MRFVVEKLHPAQRDICGRVSAFIAPDEKSAAGSQSAAAANPGTPTVAALRHAVRKRDILDDDGSGVREEDALGALTVDRMSAARNRELFSKRTIENGKRCAESDVGAHIDGIGRVTIAIRRGYGGRQRCLIGDVENSG